ncbi:hypothetical protein [Paracoccus sp. ME4]|uniref:hypothetical protein n=1 Tax=Paracoccus sp. ME4 TaxID=3138066 RepID=UPI00398A5DA0
MPSTENQILAEIGAIAATRPGEDPGMMAVRLARIEALASRPLQGPAHEGEAEHIADNDPVISL